MQLPPGPRNLNFCQKLERKYLKNRKWAKVQYVFFSIAVVKELRGVKIWWGNGAPLPRKNNFKVFTKLIFCPPPKKNQFKGTKKSRLGVQKIKSPLIKIF